MLKAAADNFDPARDNIYLPKAAVVGYRSAGSFASARRTTSSSAAGTSGALRLGGAGGRDACMRRTARIASATKGGRPASIS